MRYNSGFSILEILMVTLAVGTLTSVAMPQYEKALEVARTTEAYLMLGYLRTAEGAYFCEYGSYTADLKKLTAEIPADDSILHYFRYSVHLSPTGFAAQAMRKTGEERGKEPNAGEPYAVALSSDGILSGGL